MTDLGLRLVAILGVGKSAEQERRQGNAEAWLHSEGSSCEQLVSGWTRFGELLMGGVLCSLE
eukprot:2350101-Rhodomonas_salina.1